MRIGFIIIAIIMLLLAIVLFVVIYNQTNPKIHDPEEFMNTDEYQQQQRAKIRLVHRDKTTGYINSAWEEVNKK